MKKVNAVIAVFVIATTMFMGGCAKDGATGPAGPAGANGNANVIGTNTVTVNGVNWTALSTYFETTLTDADITQAVVDNGVVLVYAQNGTTWAALPSTFSSVSLTFQFYLGNVEIFCANTDGSQTLNPGTQIFRLVIIPSSARMTNENINFRNYEEVKRAFNLKD
jgi:hypothetical protein